jgi:glutamyl-Q tRNA(Asp) synthetase
VSSAYRGRFAPSPTGALHFGSLVAAVGSYLCARKANGAWLVRIEDLDPPREVPGSAEQIIATLAAFGFEWTEPIMRQSQRQEAYRAAVEKLLAAGLAFPCSCSRAQLQAAQASSRPGNEELHYPGWCRNGVRDPAAVTAIRLRVAPGTVTFEDVVQGTQSIDVSAETGDFVVRRRDGWYAYQLAVAVDDATQGITHVVRGADLLPSTARQILVQRALSLPTPVYAHLPLVTDANGIKLSKSEGAAALDLQRPAHELWRALRFLQQSPPPDLRSSSLANVWEWAIEHWHLPPLQTHQS